MKISNRILRFQEGGEVAPDAAAQEQMAPEAQGEQPQEGEVNEQAAMEQLMQMAQEIVNQMGPEAAAMLAQAILEIVQGGGQQEAPAEPTFQRRGGVLYKLS